MAQTNSIADTDTNQEIEDLKVSIIRHKMVIDVITQIGEEINSSLNLKEVCQFTFKLMEKHFGFSNAMILIPNQEQTELSVIESYGYDDKGIGAQIPFGTGVIGMAAKKKKVISMGNLMQQVAYLNRIRESMNISPGQARLPGLADVGSQVAVPLLIKGRLEGIYAVESHSIIPFPEEDERILMRVGNQLAIGLKNARQVEEMNRAFQLQLEKEHLEKLVDTRTKEIELQHQKLKTMYDELHQSQAQLIQSEKLAALGQLVAGVAHEVNTPIGAIKASIESIQYSMENSIFEYPMVLDQLNENEQSIFFELLKQSIHLRQNLSTREERKLRRQFYSELEEAGIEEAEDFAELLVDMGIHELKPEFLPIFNSPFKEEALQLIYNLADQNINAVNIKNAVERASKIVFALKNYSHFDKSTEKKEADLIAGLETIFTLYSNIIKKGVQLEKVYDPNLTTIWCFADELNQVWTNLIHNAIQAMDNKGKLVVRVKSIPEGVQVSMEDSGNGIPREIQPRIFDPFFTTKPVGEGSGLGLDIVKKIVEKHGGKIYFESKPGKTTFFVDLPLK